MKRDVVPIILKHIDELYEILMQYKAHNFTSFETISDEDLVFQRAVLMSVGYIGELSKKLDDHIKKQHPEINWRRLSVSRNIIFHDYDIVDMRIVATVIFRDIAILRDVLAQSE